MTHDDDNPDDLRVFSAEEWAQRRNEPGAWKKANPFALRPSALGSRAVSVDYSAAAASLAERLDAAVMHRPWLARHFFLVKTYGDGHHGIC